VRKAHAAGEKGGKNHPSLPRRNKHGKKVKSNARNTGLNLEWGISSVPEDRKKETPPH